MAENENPDRYVTIADACTIAGVSRRTIYNWLNTGKLTEVKRTAGGSIRIKASSLFVDVVEDEVVSRPQPQAVARDGKPA